MRTETTYYAFDDTEFDSAEECLAYENALNFVIDNNILFFDGDLQRMNRENSPIEVIAEEAMYMKILDGEKATGLMRWIYKYTGVCMDGLPEALHDGEVWVWDNDIGAWYNPMVQYEKLRKILDKIEKAVNAS